MNRPPHEDYEEVKSRIKLAFKHLRKLGYTCRMDFWCCSSCAWYDLKHSERVRPIDTSKIVFYNKQGSNHLKFDGKVYLQWDGNGNTIVAALRAQGLTVDWDGTQDQAIEVTGIW